MTDHPEYAALVDNLAGFDRAAYLVIADWCLDHNLDDLSWAWRHMAKQGSWPKRDSLTGMFWLWVLGANNRDAASSIPLAVAAKDHKRYWRGHETAVGSLTWLAGALADSRGEIDGPVPRAG